MSSTRMVCHGGVCTCLVKVEERGLWVGGGWWRGSPARLGASRGRGARKHAMARSSLNADAMLTHLDAVDGLAPADTVGQRPPAAVPVARPCRAVPRRAVPCHAAPWHDHVRQGRRSRVMSMAGAKTLAHVRKDGGRVPNARGVGSHAGPAANIRAAATYAPRRRAMARRVGRTW